MPLNLALVISGESSGATRATKETRDEVRELGAEAGRTQAAITAANDQATASARRATEALTGQTAAQREMNAAVAAFAGIKPANDDAGYRQRAADIAAYGTELDRIRAKFNPIFAASKQYEAEVEDLASAHKVGAISGAEYDAELVRINERYTLLARQSTVAATGLTTVGGAARLTSTQMLNLSRQGNDVVTMWLLGAPAMQIFVSQAGQVYDALESGPKGLRGSLQAIKTTLAGFGADAVATFGLIPLATAGAVAAVGAVAGGVLYLGRQIDTTSEDAKEFVAWLDKIGSSADKTASFVDKVAAAIKGMSIVDLNRLTRQSAAEIQTQRQKLTNPLATIAGFEGVQDDPAFATTYNLIDKLIGQLRSGDFKSVDELQRSLDKIVSQRPDLQRYVEEWQDLGEAIVKARLAGEQAAQQADLRAHGMGAYQPRNGADLQKYLNDNAESLFQLQRDRAAALQQVYARSPAELAAAARADEQARPLNPNESADVKKYREETAALLAQTGAQHQLDEAQRQRRISLDATLASQQLDLQLIGKTAGETAQMRLQFQLTQQLREEAERNNVKIDQDELDRITAKARAYGQYADQIAKANLQRDLQFDRDQLGRSPIEQTVASRLQGAGLEVDLGSYEAGLIRSNEILKQQVDLWKDIRQTGMDAIDAVTESGAKGFSNFGDTVEDIAQDVTKQLMQLAVANPLKNAIYGAGLPTLSDAGGVGGFLGTLLGLTPNPASGASALGGQSVGAMTVNAGTVTVTGSIGVGGGENLLTRLFSPANSNAQGGGVESQIWNFFSGKGLQPHQVAGIMGNIGAESSFNPGATNPTSGAYGLFQNLGSRLLGLGSGADLQRQLEYAWQELLGPENRVLKNLLSSTDVRGATGAFAGFERAEGFSWANPEGIDRFKVRLEGAEAALNKFAGMTSSAGGAAGQFGEGLKAGLGQFGDGLGDLWSKIGSFLQSANGGGSSWFQGLSSLFGGAGGAFNYMNSISPMATADILSGSWGLFDKGGATGGNDVRRVAGLVHEKEYVLDEPVVRAVGVPFLDNFRQAVKAGRGFANGGYGGGPAFPSDFSGSRSSGTVVNIFDQREAGTPAVEQQERVDENGQRQLDVYIRRTTQDEVGRPSASTNRQLRGMYGLKPQVVRR